MAPIHNRMPVILPREAWAKWLGEEPAERDELLSLLKPCEAARVRAYPISTVVGPTTRISAARPAAQPSD